MEVDSFKSIPDHKQMVVIEDESTCKQSTIASKENDQERVETREEKSDTVSVFKSAHRQITRTLQNSKHTTNALSNV